MAFVEHVHWFGGKLEGESHISGGETRASTGLGAEQWLCPG